MKKYRFISLLFVCTIIMNGLFSCTDDIMDDINEDKNHPHDVSAKYLVADLITNTAFSTVGGDFSLYASIYIEQEVGTHNQMYNAEVRVGEPTVASTYNNVWDAAYANIKNAKIVIEKCSTGDEVGNDITLGVGKLLLAYNAAVLTDLFGDVPFTEAGERNPDGTPKYMQPKIDKQEDIYKAIFTLVDEAITLFDGEDDGIYGTMDNKDFIYGGDAELWKKAAYALKARYTMRLLNKSTDKTGDLNDILDYVANSFTDASEELKFDVYDGDATLNPLFGFSYSRDALGASQSLLDKLDERNDPRATQMFMDFVDPVNYGFKQITDVADIYAAPNGSPEQSQLEYSLSVPCLALTAPTILMSYHELMFLKAEALCRLNQLPDAEDALLEAITAGFANQAISINSAELAFVKGNKAALDATVADTYFNTDVLPLFTANPLKETMIQKYLALWGSAGESVEAYSDFRRLKAAGEDFIELKNPKNATQFPLRFSYGSSDVTANVAIKDAYGNGQYVYTENVWWAGGTR